MRIEEIPAIRIDTMSEAEKRAYVIADNKLAMSAEWDRRALGRQLERLLAGDLNFDVETIGFSATEALALIA